MLRQVEGRDYNPPKLERILEWQAEQGFPILPKTERSRQSQFISQSKSSRFNLQIYNHIEQCQKQKAAAQETASSALRLELMEVRSVP